MVQRESIFPSLTHLVSSSVENPLEPEAGVRTHCTPNEQRRLVQPKEVKANDLSKYAV